MKYINKQIIRVLTLFLIIFISGISLADINSTRNEESNDDDKKLEELGGAEVVTSYESWQAWCSNNLQSLKDSASSLVNNNVQYFKDKASSAADTVLNIPGTIVDKFKGIGTNLYSNSKTYWNYLMPSTTPFTPPSTTPFTPPSTTPFTPPSTTTFTPPSTTSFTPPTNNIPSAPLYNSKAAYSANNPITVKYIRTNRNITEMSEDKFMKLVVNKSIEESREALSKSINIRNIQLKLNSLQISNQMLDR